MSKFRLVIEKGRKIETRGTNLHELHNFGKVLRVINGAALSCLLVSFTSEAKAQTISTSFDASGMVKKINTMKLSREYEQLVIKYVREIDSLLKDQGANAALLRVIGRCYPEYKQNNVNLLFPIYVDTIKYPAHTLYEGDGKSKIIFDPIVIAQINASLGEYASSVDYGPKRLIYHELFHYLVLSLGKSDEEVLTLYKNSFGKYALLYESYVDYCVNLVFSEQKRRYFNVNAELMMYILHSTMGESALTDLAHCNIEGFKKRFYKIFVGADNRDFSRIFEYPLENLLVDNQNAKIDNVTFKECVQLLNLVQKTTKTSPGELISQYKIMNSSTSIVWSNGFYLMCGVQNLGTVQSGETLIIKEIHIGTTNNEFHTVTNIQDPLLRRLPEDLLKVIHQYLPSVKNK